MMAAPMRMARDVPSVPATGRNMVPGIRNEPQPMQQPNASAHSVNEESFTFSIRDMPPLPLISQ